jgi:hypothetical protein
LWIGFLLAIYKERLFILDAAKPHVVAGIVGWISTAVSAVNEER